MKINFADKFLDSLDEIVRGYRGWTKADHSQYFPLVCPHSNDSMALFNGSLLSVIKIDGYLGQYVPGAFDSLCTEWQTFIRNTAQDKTSKGFDLFWSFEYDPEGMQDKTHHYREKMIRASQRRGIDVRDILEEEAEVYGKICANETQLLLVVTHIDSLPISDRKDALAQSGKDRSQALRGKDAMLMSMGIKGIEAIHEQHVNKVMIFLQEAGMGYTAHRLNCYDALTAMRMSLVPGVTAGWRPKLTINDTRFRTTEGVSLGHKVAQGTEQPNDWSFMLPPPLHSQMVPDGMVDLGRYVVSGSRTYAPMYVSELAVDPRPLEELLIMCHRRRLPIRLVYSMMSNSDQANYWNRMFASIFTFASASNKQIKKADDAMREYQLSGGAVLGYGLSIATWAETDVTYSQNGEARYGVKQLQKRAQDVEALVQQWGGQQVDSIFGCAVQGLFGATPGYAVPSTAPKAPQIELDVVKQLPLMRPARLWEPDNSIWFRTEEGVLSPYQPMSGRQNAMLSLVLGGMGFGKSNLISEHIHYFANHPDASVTPYIRGIDFGASSSGVIDLIRESLPDDRKHEAVFEIFATDGSFVKNMFDTRPGLKYPLQDHRKFLESWLLVLCDGLIDTPSMMSNVVAVLHAAVERVYEMNDPDSNLFQGKMYSPATALPEVVQAVAKVNMTGIDEHTTYWDITNSLLHYALEHNDDQVMYAAKLAQRYCSPEFRDVVHAADQLSSQFEGMPTVDGVPLTSAVARALMNANAAFKCFSGVTNTDISESRICVFDMSEAFGRGTSAYDDWLRTVYFAVVYRLLTEDLFVNKDMSGEEIKLNQRQLGCSDALLDWYMVYLEQQDQVDKVFWADELHRLGRVQGGLDIIASMGYEGRKYKVGLLLGTQVPENMPPTMLPLASSIFVFGTNQSNEMARTIQRLFDLNDDECAILAKITKPNAEKGAEVFCIHKVDSGTQRLKLHFQLGAIKRWAYATETDERGLRGILYREGKSTAWARQTLARHVPSAKAAIKAKQAMLEARGQEISSDEAIRLIADDLLKL